MSEFTKYDGEKRRYDLVPYDSLEQIIEVLEYGAEKYSDDNWKKCDEPVRYFAAAMRHLTAWIRGERLDQESGLPHLAHAGCCVLFLIGLTNND
jgi:hypothetical protein